MLRIALAISLLAVSGCDGGGIAGAGFDSEAMVREAEQYRSYVSPLLQETVERDCEDGLTQQFESMFSDFRASYPRIEEQPIHIAELEAAASSQENVFALRRKHTYLVREQLPSVFYMHPVSLGVHSLSGHDLIMISTKSRATTGLYFVAIYGSDGTPYYKSVLSGGQVWDIRAAQKHIEFRRPL